MSPRDPSLDNDSDPGKYAKLDGLAAEFAARYRRGERPTLDEYAARHPELADEIREVFPAMVGLEQAEEIRKDHSGDRTADEPPALSQVGDFRILRQVGRGGMGVVYEAEQVSLGRRVALKVLPGGPLRDARSLERFRYEARAAARLHHTNIVPVFEVGQDGDILYFSMQFIRGQGLDLVVDELRRLRGLRRRDAGMSSHARGNSARWLAESLLTGRISLQGQPAAPGGSRSSSADGGPTTRMSRESGSSWGADDRGAESPASAVMPGGTQISAIESSGSRQPYFRSIAQIGHQVADALAYAHARGVVHRDIKPSNLLLDTSGVVWVTDFGLAKAEDSGLTATGDILGTLRYMAPERLRGEGDARADVYALGLTLYELLTLRPAFDSSDRLELIDRIKGQEPPRPRALAPGISRDLETLLLKSIEKDPRRRYQSAGEMAEDLRRYLDGEPIRARQVGELERAWKWAMKRKSLAGLMLLAVASLVIGMAVSLVFLLQARRYASLADARASEAADAALEARRAAADARVAAAQATAESGEIDRGLYGLIDALELAPVATPGDRARRRAILRNVEAWLAATPALRYMIDGLSPETRIEFTGPDGTVIALITGNQMRRIDLATGRPVGDPRGLELPAPILAVSADGSLAVTAAEIPNRPQRAWDVRVLEVESGRQRVQLPPLDYDQMEQDVIFDPGGRYIALRFPVGRRGWAGGPYVRRCWKIDTTAPVPAGPKADVPDRWTRSEVRIVAGREGHAILVYPEPHGFQELGFSKRLAFWDLDRQTRIERLEPERASGVARSISNEGHYLDCAFDGRHLVYAHDSGLVRWWDLATGLPARPDWRPWRASSQATLAGDARMLVVRCDDNRVRFYELATGRECGPAPSLAGSEVGIAPQGSFLLARRGDKLAVWQTASAPRPPHPGSIDTIERVYSAMAAARDGREYAVGSAPAEGSTMGRDTLNTLVKLVATRPSAVGHRYATDDGRPLGGPLDPLGSHPCYSPDGRLIAACRTQAKKGGVLQDVVVAAWNRESDRAVLPWTRLPQYVHSLAFSPDGRTLAAGVISGTWLLDTRPGRPPRFLPQPGPIARLEFSPDGRRMAAGARSGWDAVPGVRIWDPGSGQPVGPAFPTRRLPFFQFSPHSDALVLVDTGGRRLARLDARTGRPIAPAVALAGAETELPTGDRHVTSTVSLAVTMRPDGQAVAESPTAGTARQYDARTGRPIGPLLDHGDTIGWLVYSPDGLTLASACLDGTLRLWDAPTGAPLGPPLSPGLPILGVFFGPDQSRLNVVTIDGRATSWPVPGLPETEDVRRLRLRIEVVTGQRITGTGDELLDLPPAAWRASRDRLEIVSPGALRGDDVRPVLARWHRDRADDARRQGDEQARSHHLARLAELIPDDWLADAENAAPLAQTDRAGGATQTFDRLASRARPDDLASWIWNRAVEDLSAGRAAAALGGLERVVAARTGDWRVHAHRADALDHLGRSAEARFARELACETGADAIFIAEAGAEQAARRDWIGADRLLSLAASRGHDVPVDRALVCATLGDVDGYRRACRSILARIAARPGPAPIGASIEAAWAVGLAPGGVDDYALPLSLAEAALAAIPGLTAPADVVREIERDVRRSRIAVLLRAGRFEQALVALKKAPAGKDGDPADALLEVIGLARTGRYADARTRLASARPALAAARRNSSSWQDREALELLAAEAEGLVLDRDFPAAPFASP